MNKFAVRGPIFDLTGNPQKESGAWRYFDDGVMLVSDGLVEYVASADECVNSLENQVEILEYPECLICPGFIDSHVHFAQTRIIGSPAPGLLEWLETYTFPEEQRFGDAIYCLWVASEFLDELGSNGTTSALVYPTVHENSAEIFFLEAERRGVRMASGKVLMNRNAPYWLMDDRNCGEPETERLIHKWHGRGRQTYAITLRFAGTSTHDQMELCRRLLQKYPDFLFQTHLSETLAEIDWTLQLYPECSDYLEVYEKYGLVADRSVFAHCIHLSDSEKKRLADAGANIALCPTSNTFLGSGLVPMDDLADHGISMALGTDVGGGTSFSMLQTMQEMYKVVKLGSGRSMNAMELFYLATLGGARALRIDEHVGNFEKGKEADFVVLDAGKNVVMQKRFKDSPSLEKVLFSYIFLGDSRNVRETWSMGRRIHQRDCNQMTVTQSRIETDMMKSSWALYQD